VKPIVLKPGEGDAGPGFPGPPPHRHRETFDMFFVSKYDVELV
jgi:hypothetical protein